MAGTFRKIVKMGRYQKALRELERYKALAFTDPMTGLRTQTWLAENETPAAYYVYLDLDNFKTVNDKLGHEQGNTTISSFGRYLLENTRKDLDKIRCGGDEFLIFAESKETAEKILERVSQWTIEYDDGITVTVSGGIGKTISIAEKNMRDAKAASGKAR